MYRTLYTTPAWTIAGCPVNEGPYYFYYVGEPDAQSSTRIKMRGIVLRTKRILSLKEDTNLKHKDMYWKGLNTSLPMQVYLNYTPVNYA